MKRGNRGCCETMTRVGPGAGKRVRWLAVGGLVLAAACGGVDAADGGPDSPGSPPDTALRRRPSTGLDQYVTIGVRCIY